MRTEAARSFNQQLLNKSPKNTLFSGNL
jgi:CheY-like chemotaxis protein